MKLYQYLFLIFFSCPVLILGQSHHPNRSYQAGFNYTLVNQAEDDFNVYHLYFNHGIHNDKGVAFLYDISIKKLAEAKEIELITSLRKSYLRKEKIEAYVGTQVGARRFKPERFLDLGTDTQLDFFTAFEAGYLFFLNKNAALELNASYPYLTTRKGSSNIRTDVSYTVGQLNSTLRLRYFLKSQKKENLTPDSYRLYKSRWMIGGSIELGSLNEFDNDGCPLLNIIKPVVGIMANDHWMVGSGVQISSSRKTDLIYFGVSLFTRVYLIESLPRTTMYWDLWTQLENRADRARTTKDYALHSIGAGSGFGVGYWLSPNVNLNFALGLRVFKNAEIIEISVDSPLNNLVYFNIGLETYL